MILTVVAAKIFEDKLAEFTVEKLESKIDAPMSVGKVSLIPLFSFPRLSAEINKLYIGDPQTQYNDTLFFINSLKIGLDSWDLIHGIYTIDEMKISGLDIDYEIDSAGKSNIDFIVDAFVVPDQEVKSDTVSTPLDLSAEKLKLENIHVSYYDSLNNFGSEITIPKITITAKAKNSIYRGKAVGGFVLSNSIFKDTKLNKMESCTVGFDLEYKDKEAKISELSIISDGINLGVEGTFEIDDTLILNTIIKANNLDLDILKKYLPDQYAAYFSDVNLGQMESISIDANMSYGNNNVDVKNLLIDSDAVDLAMEGTMVNSDTVSINAEIKSLHLNFDFLKRFIPKQYYNEYGITDLGGILDISGDIEGKLADSTILPLFNANVSFSELYLKTVDYPQVDNANLLVKISSGEKTDLSEASIDIENIKVISGENNLRLEGNVSGLENTQYSIRSNMAVNLSDFEDLIPDSLAHGIKGSITASIKTSGIMPKQITEEFMDNVLDNTIISLKIKDVGAVLTDSLRVESFSTDIKYAPQGSGAKEININNLYAKSSTLNLNLEKSSILAIVSGDISEPLKMSANLKSIKIKNGESQIIGNGEISNLETPEFDIKTNIILSLEELEPFVPDSLINSMEGIIVAYVKSKGKINPDSLDNQIFPILFENSILDLALKNICLAFPDSTMDVDNFSARIGLKNDILSINNLSANYNGLEFGMDSSIVKNIYSTIILNKSEELYVKTHISFGDFIFDDFKHLLPIDAPESEGATNPTVEKTTSDSNITGVSRNWTYLIYGSASINSIIVDSTALEGFDINRLHINDLSTLCKITDSSYIIDQFKFKVFEGEMDNSFNYKLRKDGTQSVSSHNIVRNMNVHTMLKDMDNFGMDSVISYENISGLFSTDLHTFVPIDDSIRIDKMLVSGDITLEKGGVYDYAPATEISKFTSIKELDNIQFKTLRSNIFMFKNKLYVPRTNIVSNALDIAAFGMQDLDGDCEYHLELHLSNILFGKSKRRNKKQDKSGEEVDEKSLKKNSRKIKYAITDKKSKVGLDTKDSRNDMMNKIRVQKKMLDFIFLPKNIHYNTSPE